VPGGNLHARADLTGAAAPDGPEGRAARRIDRIAERTWIVEMGIVRFALKFPYTFYVLAVRIVFLGVSAITVMPQDIFPEINIPVVSVIWQ
jgi:hypothetical protein